MAAELKLFSFPVAFSGVKWSRRSRDSVLIYYLRNFSVFGNIAQQVYED